jgi:hypothetical protein
MPELRAIVAEDQARWDTLAELWNDLMPDEQERVIEVARGYAAANVEEQA